MLPKEVPASEVSAPLKTSGGSPSGHPSRLLGTRWPAVVVPRRLRCWAGRPTPCSRQALRTHHGRGSTRRSTPGHRRGEGRHALLLVPLAGGRSWLLGAPLWLKRGIWGDGSGASWVPDGPLWGTCGGLWCWRGRSHAVQPTSPVYAPWSGGVRAGALRTTGEARADARGRLRRPGEWSLGWLTRGRHSPPWRTGVAVADRRGRDPRARSARAPCGPGVFG